jgi:hypothetical protein
MVAMVSRVWCKVSSDAVGDIGDEPLVGLQSLIPLVGILPLPFVITDKSCNFIVVVLRGDGVASKIDHATPPKAFATTIVESSIIQVLLRFSKVIPVAAWDIIFVLPAVSINTMLKATVRPPSFD